MVTEVAEFVIRPGAEADFTAAYHQAEGLVAASPGCRSMRMTQSLETPTRFLLLVEWDTVEAHVAFRATERLGQWRALIGPHFAAPPSVEHVVEV